MSAVLQFDTRAQHEHIHDEVSQAITRVLHSGHFILGPEVEAFETEFANFIGVPYAVSCASGTDALHLSLSAAGVGRGDEVITSTFSFIASAGAIMLAEATPVFVDIDRRSFNMSPAAVMSAITERTKAILVPHLYGHPADMTALKEIADKHKLVLVEDCAQAFGAKYNGQYVGTLATAGCFSFYPTKILGAYGDGGMITVNDADTAEHIKRLRNHGQDPKLGQASQLGWNSRLDEIQATILRIKLKYVKRYIEQRQQLAAIYSNHLNNQDSLQTPMTADGCEHVFNQYTLLHEKRDELASYLSARDIQTRIYYACTLPEHQSISSDPKRHEHAHTLYPESAYCSRACLSLPLYPELEPSAVEHVAAEIVNYLAGR